MNFILYKTCQYWLLLSKWYSDMQDYLSNRILWQIVMIIWQIWKNNQSQRRRYSAKHTKHSYQMLYGQWIQMSMVAPGATCRSQSPKPPNPNPISGGVSADSLMGKNAKISIPVILLVFLTLSRHVPWDYRFIFNCPLYKGDFFACCFAFSWFIF